MDFWECIECRASSAGGDEACSRTRPADDHVTLGTFETWICERCGYTEFYAKGLAGLAELVSKYPEQIRIVG
jgi:predicted nucleic-acid-binding Zn-ribbon protein